jgi:hypothetical protein
LQVQTKWTEVVWEVEEEQEQEQEQEEVQDEEEADGKLRAGDEGHSKGGGQKISQMSQHKCPWDEAQDAQLCHQASGKELEKIEWGKIADVLGRTPKACRQRYLRLRQRGRVGKAGRLWGLAPTAQTARSSELHPERAAAYDPRAAQSAFEALSSNQRQEQREAAQALSRASRGEAREALRKSAELAEARERQAEAEMRASNAVGEEETGASQTPVPGSQLGSRRAEWSGLASAPTAAGAMPQEASQAGQPAASTLSGDAS